MTLDTTGLRDVLDTIRDFAVPLSVTRLKNEDAVDGFVSLVTESIAGVTGHMQPLSPKELRYVPQGLNTLEWWNIWSLVEIFAQDQVTDGTAPIVTVQKLESWKEAPFWHTQGIVVTDDISFPPSIYIVTGSFLGPYLTGAGVASHP